MIRRIVGPVVALGGVVLLGSGLFEYFFVPSEKVTFVDLVRGVGIAAMLIGVGVSWSRGKVHGDRSITREDDRKEAASIDDQST